MKKFFYDRYLEDNGRTIRLYQSDMNGKAKKLITGFLSEIPTITVANEWGNSGTTLVSTIVDAIGGVMNSSLGIRAAESIENIGNYLPMDKVLGAGSKDEFKGFMSKVKTLQNAHITGIENLIKTYKGTSVTLSGMNLKIVMLNSSLTTDIRSELNNLLAVTTGTFDADYSFKGLVGTQLAPNGYTIKYDSALEGIMAGTFILEIGNILKIPNILVSNVEYKISPVCVMDNNGNSTGEPLFIEVDVSVELARIITPNELSSLYVNNLRR